MPRDKKEPQIAMDERIVEDPELAQAIKDKAKNADAAKAYKDAHNVIKERAIEQHGLRPGEALRVDEYRIEGGLRSSTGGSIRPYTRTVISKITGGSN
jgi:hypothetical protein